MRSRTEITIETERVLVVGQHNNRMFWCSRCAGVRSMLTLAEVTKITGIAPLAIYELAEVCRIHFVLTAKGEFLICPDSPVLSSEDVTL
ncbi:MAG TPA: hypothetical protein VLL54_14685 [Pyrinomonadaceae bacterium]|nr:hypothetical protein [Pyrinomonadaceae bacterium]